MDVWRARWGNFAFNRTSIRHSLFSTMWFGLKNCLNRIWTKFWIGLALVTIAYFEAIRRCASNSLLSSYGLLSRTAACRQHNPSQFRRRPVPSISSESSILEKSEAKANSHAWQISIHSRASCAGHCDCSLKFQTKIPALTRQHILRIFAFLTLERHFLG